MTDRQFNALMKLAKDELEEEMTPEEALARLMRAGILDENGDFTEPYAELRSIFVKVAPES